jgi:coenzyme F420-reducing hydrogenase alpha subunit
MKNATLAYHWARMIEMLHAAETVKDLLQDDDIIGKEPPPAASVTAAASA